jgi:tRNA-2-methylthio-N6-dimethylallyladenosine synthase
LGRTEDVLLEKPGKLPGQLVGRTPYLQAVQVMAPRSMIGSLVQVTITDIGTNTLFGALARERRAPVAAAAGA